MRFFRIVSLKATEARTFGVEQTRDGQRGALVFKQGKKIDGVAESFQKRLAQAKRRARRESGERARIRLRLVQLGECVKQFAARLSRVFVETRRVAPVNAASGK